MKRLCRESKSRDQPAGKPGNAEIEFLMSALGQKQTSRHVPRNVRYSLKADIHKRGLHVRFSAKSGHFADFTTRQGLASNARASIRRHIREVAQGGLLDEDTRRERQRQRQNEKASQDPSSNGIPISVQKPARIHRVANDPVWTCADDALYTAAF